MSATAVLAADDFRRVCAEVMEQSQFIALPPLSLAWEHSAKEITAWEVFRGQLVPENQTRLTRDFESWSVYGRDETGHSDEPLLSIKLDTERSELHVVRAILCYVWEGYDAGENTYLSREVERWRRELVGTLHTAEFATDEALRAELAMLVFHAVVGCSRLPLTSVEAPLPAWSLGRLAYWPGGMPRCLADKALAPKVLEWLVRSTPANQLTEIVAQFLTLWSGPDKTPADTAYLFRAMFNEVSLSPYTDFVDKTLEFLRLLVSKEHLSAPQHVDFLSWLLRQLARHLTAYDLVTFHHRGANYPDALLLDVALKEYLRLIEQRPALFTADDDAARKRRRALRLGWLHRRRYEGHPVPDAPTSPGENTRVLPPPHVCVPEEQILNLGKRTKRLYAGDPLPGHVGPCGNQVLQQCGRDLENENELGELGMAIFIERPLASAKSPGEPDTSPLLAHEAFSWSLADRALMELARDPLFELSAEDVGRWRSTLKRMAPSGIQAIDLPTEPSRVVSLADAAKAASDFVILRTLSGSIEAFCKHISVAAESKQSGASFNAEGCRLIVASIDATGKPVVAFLDATGKVMLHLEVGTA